MMRLIVQRVGCCPSGDVIERGYVTFDIDLPEIEKLLNEQHGYVAYSVIGAEVRPADHSSAMQEKP
jgi:hypothetical protein